MLISFGLPLSLLGLSVCISPAFPGRGLSFSPCSLQIPSICEGEPQIGSIGRATLEVSPWLMWIDWFWRFSTQISGGLQSAKPKTEEVDASEGYCSSHGCILCGSFTQSFQQINWFESIFLWTVYWILKHRSILGGRSRPTWRWVFLFGVMGIHSTFTLPGIWITWFFVCFLIGIGNWNWGQ